MIQQAAFIYPVLNEEKVMVNDLVKESKDSLVTIDNLVKRSGYSNSLKAKTIRMVESYFDMSDEVM